MDNFVKRYRECQGDDQLDLFPEEPKKSWFWDNVPFLVIIAVLALLLVTAGWTFPAQAEEQHQHPPQDVENHERFYKHWMRPDLPTSSCCNLKDCYATEIKYIEGKLHAKRREDQKWVAVPPEKIDQVNTSPDGRNHVCMPSPSYYIPWGCDVRTSGMTGDTVYCFIYGQGI